MASVALKDFWLISSEKTIGSFELGFCEAKCWKIKLLKIGNDVICNKYKKYWFNYLRSSHAIYMSSFNSLLEGQKDKGTWRLI